MNAPLPDRVVIAVIALTVILVFAMAFALKTRQNYEPFLWRDPPPAPPAQISAFVPRGTVVI